MHKLGFKHLAVSALAASLFLACGGSDKDPDGDNPGGGTTAKQTAALSGRVDLAERTELKDGTVTAYEIEKDGALTKVSSATAIDAGGKYTLTVEVGDDTFDDLLVRAEKGTAHADVLVSGTLAAKGTATAAPIDAETSAEAEVYVHARAKGIWTEHASKVLLREMISAEMGAELRNAMDHDAAIDAAAKGVTAAVIAWDGMLRREELGVAGEQVDAFLQLEASAQAKLDQSLDAAATAELEAQAFTQYRTSMDQAWDMAAISVEQRAAAAQAAAVSMRVYAQQLAPRFVVAAEQMRAATVTAAIEAQFSLVSEVETDREAVADAGVLLRATIDGAIAAGADAPQRIASAWSEYHTAVRARMDKNLELAQRAALINVELALTGAESALRTSLGRVTANASPAVTAAAVVNAYGTFSAAVTAPAQITALATASVNLDRARALLEMMLLLDSSEEGTVVISAS